MPAGQPRETAIKLEKESPNHLTKRRITDWVNNVPRWYSFPKLDDGDSDSESDKKRIKIKEEPESD